MIMDDYQQLLEIVRDAAAAIFSAATTEVEVCELEQAVYEEIDQIAARRTADLS